MFRQYCDVWHKRIFSCCGRVLIALCVVMVGCSKPPPPPPPVVSIPEPAEVQKGIEITEIDAVTLLPNATSEFTVQVVRNGHEGSVAISFEDLPGGFKINPERLEIKKGSSAGKAVLQALPSLGDKPVKASLAVNAKLREMTASQALQVIVDKVVRPEFGSVPTVLLQPDSSKTILLPIKRNGFVGKLPVVISGGSPSLMAKLEPLAEEKNNDDIKIVVSADTAATDGPVSLEVAATVYGRKVIGRIPVEVSRYPFRVESFRVIDLKQKANEVIRLPVQRKKYKGPLKVGIKNLPDGVDALVSPVAADDQEVSVTLSVSPTARPQVRSSLIVASAGDLQTSNFMVVRVLAEDEEKLPAGIINVSAIKKIFIDPSDAAPLRRKGSIGGRLTLASKQALIDFYGATPESLGINTRRSCLVSELSAQ